MVPLQCQLKHKRGREREMVPLQVSNETQERDGGRRKRYPCRSQLKHKRGRAEEMVPLQVPIETQEREGGRGKWYPWSVS